MQGSLVNKLILAGSVIFLIGLVLMLASSVSSLNFSTTPSPSNVQGGYVAVIMLGPFPIVIGEGSPAVVQTGEIIGGILAVLLIALYVIMWRRASRRV